MTLDNPDRDVEPTDEPGSSSVDEPRRAWMRPGSKQSTTDDDGVIPFDDLHLHRYCAVYPYAPDDDPVYLTDKEYAKVVGDRVATGPGDIPVDRVEFLSGYARHVVRHTPMAVLITTIVLFLSAEFVEGVGGLSAFLPVLSPIEWVMVATGVVLYAVLLLLILDIGLFDWEEVYKSVIVYGLITFLSIGSLISIYLVFRHTPIITDPTILVDGGQAIAGANGIPNNIVFVSGYLLLILLGGLFTYDGLLRTEYLIENLDLTHLVQNKGAYDYWVTGVRNQLSHTIGESWNPLHDQIPIRTAHLFSVVFLIQYAVYWSIGRGPQNLDFSLTIVVNLLFNFLLVVVAFQFVLLITALYRLLNEDRDDRPRFGGLSVDGNRILGYLPGHTDGRAGYRDIGKFATRVNLMLILGGFYCVYRLFFQGSRVTPHELVPEGTHVLFGAAIWFQSFLAPVLLYGFVACAWMYYSFWQVHLRMLRERERHYLKRTNTLNDLSDWSIREGAPVWPVHNGLLWSLISGTVGPLVLYLFEML